MWRPLAVTRQKLRLTERYTRTSGEDEGRSHGYPSPVRRNLNGSSASSLPIIWSVAQSMNIPMRCTILIQAAQRWGDSLRRLYAKVRSH